MADEQGSLFSGGDYEQAAKPPPSPGWGTAHGRPNYPGQGPAPQPTAFQPQLTRAPLGHQAYPKEHPPEFAASGIGKYFTRNANGNQFNKPAIMGAIQNLAQGYRDSKYFAHAGMGEALGYTVGIGSTPSHPGDDIRTRMRAEEREAAMGGNHGVTGANPGHVAGFHSGHPASSFEPGLSW